MTIIDYDNGNCHVTLDTATGTKTRECDGIPKPEFPESIDLKITDRCNKGCTFCHESSTPGGGHTAASEVMRITEGLTEGVEIAIGGGNPMEHPSVVSVIHSLTCRGLVCNLTLRIDHALADYGRLFQWRRNRFIYGVGLSGAGHFAGMIEQIQPGLIDSNTVMHFVAGVDSVQNLRCATGADYKILILGYKRRGRGVTHYSDKVADNIDAWRYFLPSLLSMKNLTISFDNLALEQLNVIRMVPDDVWQASYMGDDGQFTMYVDAVKMEYAASSVDDRKPLGSMTIRDAFQTLKGNQR